MKKIAILILFCLIRQFHAQNIIISGILTQPNETNGVRGLSTEYPMTIELTQKKNNFSETSFFITPDGNYFVQMRLKGIKTDEKIILTEDKIIKGVAFNGVYFLKELILYINKDGTVGGTWKDLGSSGVRGSFTGRLVEMMKIK